MQLYNFLSALPAVLALAGVVLYELLGANKAGDDISRRIVDKLRSAAPDEIPPDRRLTPRQVDQLLRQQQRLRARVGEHDFCLLTQALKQQFILSICVYVLSLGFCAWSVYLFVQAPTAPRKAASPLGMNAASSVQVSSGDKSPNVNSSGSGPVTVTIQDQAQPIPASPWDPLESTCRHASLSIL